MIIPPLKPARPLWVRRTRLVVNGQVAPPQVVTPEEQVVVGILDGSFVEAAAGVLDSAMKRLLDGGIAPTPPSIPAPAEGLPGPPVVVRELSTKEHLRLCRQACREAVGLPKDGSNN